MRFLLKIVKWILVAGVFIPAVVALFLCFNTVEVPQCAVEAFLRRISAPGRTVTVKRTLLRLTKGLRFENVRIDGIDGSAKARSIDVAVDFFSIPWKAERMIREIVVRELDFPRIVTFAAQHPDEKDAEEEEFSLPDARPFNIRLIKPNILGIRLKSAEAGRVRISHDGIRMDDLRGVWPDADAAMKVAGQLELSLETKHLKASVRGQARQHNIRPLLEVLDVQSSFEYMDAFTGIVAPIDASYSIDADLSDGSVAMTLDLHPASGAYRGMPFEAMHGRLDIAFKADGTNETFRVQVGPLKARFADSSRLKGSLTVSGTNDTIRLHFAGIESSLAISNAMTVSEVLSQDLFDFVRCAEGPVLTLDGDLELLDGTLSGGRIGGEGKLKRASIFDVALSDAGFAWSFDAAGIAEVKRFRSGTAHGGQLAGGAKIESGDEGAFHLDVQASDVPLEDLADAFKTDIGDRHGMVNATFSISGTPGEGMKKSLHGAGSARCEHGHLAQLNLFSGFTDYLVEHVPGVASLVQQSRSSFTFNIDKGVLKTDNFLVEGDVFSIRAEGTYDIDRDNLDFKVHVNLFRNDSILSHLTSPISWTFNKLLLEFRVTGSLEDPVWQNISIIGGIGAKGQKK